MSVYLDHAASTPVRPAAADAYTRTLADVGNPSSVHRHGQGARAIVEEARESVAKNLDCEPIEVIFTSGGTESINLGLVGLYRQAVENNPLTNRIVVPEAEHHATLDTVIWLEQHEQAVVEWIPVDSTGRIEMSALASVLSREPETIALVTMLWANNEVGTLQPVSEVAQLAATHSIPLHVDAVAAAGHEKISFAKIREESHAQPGSGLVALSISGHKFGSVPGVGALIVSRDALLEPLIHGGGQQRGLRSGTLDAPAVASLGVALEEAIAEREQENARLGALQRSTIARVRELIPEVKLSGDEELRLTNNVNFTFAGCQSDSLLFLLDEAGVSVSTGSACQAGVAQPSHVLLAMGHNEREASSALRITFGHTTTESDVEKFLVALPEAVERARRAGTTV